MYGCSESKQKWSKADTKTKRDACLRALSELEKVATVAGDDVVILFGQAWDTILQTGRLSGRIDVDWFLSQGSKIDSLSTGQQGLPNDHPFILSHPRSGNPNSYYQATSEASYNQGPLHRVLFSTQKGKAEKRFTQFCLPKSEKVILPLFACTLNLAPSAECRQGLLILPLASSHCG